MAKREMTVSEFASLGGKARAASMTKQERKELARLAGNARAASMTKQQRSEIGRKAAAARWKKAKTK